MSKELEDIKKQVGKPLPAKAILLEMANASLEFYNERVLPEQRLTETEFNQIKEVIEKYGK